MQTLQYSCTDKQLHADTAGEQRERESPNVRQHILDMRYGPRLNSDSSSTGQSYLWPLTNSSAHTRKASVAGDLEKAALNSAVAGNWNGIVAAVNLSGKRNKQYAGLDPGYVMTIISYKNSPLFCLD